MQEEKLIDAAVDLRRATLRADKQGIILYTKGIEGISTEDSFLIYGTETFKELIKTRHYAIERCKDNEYKYKYIVKVDGLNFTHMTKELLYTGDEEILLESEGAAPCLEV